MTTEDNNNLPPALAAVCETLDCRVTTEENTEEDASWRASLDSCDGRSVAEAHGRDRADALRALHDKLRPAARAILADESRGGAKR